MSKGESLLSALDTIQLIINFSIFIIALISLIIDSLQTTTKVTAHIFGEITVTNL
ncbi:putative holin-like toxin [Enterococcus rotai]|uniref:putative holin-like toxin n=1 Tax=Enterococcus rotai TaxID=118060 RepID=UPI001AD82332|nr:putative holin-like toxin [Enterococcus rotai]